MSKTEQNLAYMRRKFDMKLVKKKFENKPSRVDRLKKRFDNSFSDPNTSSCKPGEVMPIKDITGKTTPCMVAKPEKTEDKKKTYSCVFSKRDSQRKTTPSLFKARDSNIDVLESDCVNIFIYADDKSSRGPDAGTAVAMDSKQVDDKFKEIMQKKRKGIINTIPYFGLFMCTHLS